MTLWSLKLIHLVTMDSSHSQSFVLEISLLLSRLYALKRYHICKYLHSITHLADLTDQQTPQLMTPSQGAGSCWGHNVLL